MGVLLQTPRLKLVSKISNLETQLNQPTPPLERRRVAVPHRAQSRRAEGILRQQLKRVENCTHRADSRPTMKSQLIAIVAAVLLVGTAFADQIHDATKSGDLAGVQAELD